MSTYDNAVCWCLVGAVGKCSQLGNNLTSGEWSKAVKFLDQVAGMNAAKFNDTHDHAEVIGLIAKARKLAGES
jgi:hypothetical protein